MVATLKGLVAKNINFGNYANENYEIQKNSTN